MRLFERMESTSRRQCTTPEAVELCLYLTDDIGVVFIYLLWSYSTAPRGWGYASSIPR